MDIEYFSDRVERIASKFLRKDEKAEDLDAKLDAEILKAQEKIDNLTAVQNDTAIINELARKVN